MPNDMCEGCVAMSGELLFCFVRVDFKEHGDCPCGNCIVKMMCSIVCPERTSYYYDGKADKAKKEIEIILRG